MSVDYSHLTKDVPFEVRFWARVDKRDDDECWPWIGYLNCDGYGGWVKTNGVTHSAHRASWLIHHGELPPADLEVDHVCRNRACVNPAHLRAVTHRVNVLASDGVSARNIAKTQCDNGHEYTVDNTRLENSGAHRKCRACNAAAARRYRARKRHDG